MIVCTHHLVYVGVIGTPREVFDFREWMDANCPGHWPAYQHPKPCLEEFLKTETYHEYHRIVGDATQPCRPGEVVELNAAITVMRTRNLLRLPSSDIYVSDDFIIRSINEMMGMSFHNEFLLGNREKDLAKIKLTFDVEEL